MFKNETGLQVFEAGDVVQVGNGKVGWSVVNEASSGNYNIQSHNTGKFQFVNADRLTIVEDVRKTQEWQDSRKEEFSKLTPKDVAFGFTHGNGTTEEIDPTPVPDSYALAIFVALQRKPIFQGFLNPLKPRKVRASRRLRKMAKNARRAQRAA